MCVFFCLLYFRWIVDDVLTMRQVLDLWGTGSTMDQVIKGVSVPKVPPGQVYWLDGDEWQRFEKLPDQ